MNIRFSVLAVATLMAGSAHANLITNGSFESPLVPVAGFATFSTGSTSITGWTVVGPQVAVVSGAFGQFGFSFPAQDGSQWLDLTGNGANSPLNGVTQTIATTLGTTYNLSFWVGNTVNPDGIFGTTSTVNLSINGGPSTSYQNSGIVGTASQSWQQFATSFTATSALTSLTFLNGDPANDNNIGLDNVEFVSGPGPGPGPLPEPATLALLTLGLAGLGASRSRRQ